MNMKLRNHNSSRASDSISRLLTIVFLTLLLSACATAPPPEKVASYWDGYLTVAVSPNGKMAAAANRMVVVLFDLEQQRQAGWFWAIDERGKSFKLPRSGIGDTLEFIDDFHIVTTGMGGLATVWDIRNGSKIAHLDPPSNGVHAISLAYSPVSGKLALGTRDGTILVTQLDGDEFSEPAPLLSHVGRVNDLAFSQDGKYMASAGHDKAVLIWDMESQSEIGRLDSTGDISDLEVFSQQRSLIIAGDDVAVWQFLSEDEALALTEDKAIGQWLGTSAIYALQAGLLFTGLGGGLATHDPKNCGRFVTVSPDGSYLVDVKPGPLTNKVTVLDIEQNEILHEVDVKNAICDVEFTADGSRLVLAGDGGMFLVDVATWALLPLYMMVDGFSHAPRVVLAEPKKMGLDVTGHALAIGTAAETNPEEPSTVAAPEESSEISSGQE